MLKIANSISLTHEDFYGGALSVMSFHLIDRIKLAKS